MPRTQLPERRNHREMRKRSSVALATLCAATLATGCENVFEGDCIDIGLSGIQATVVDATTNKPPLALPTLRIEEGDFVEQHTIPSSLDPLLFAGAVERPGTYRVIVQASGYQAFSVDGVRVTRGGDCQYLQPARITISLQRAP